MSLSLFRIKLSLREDDEEDKGENRDSKGRTLVIYGCRRDSRLGQGIKRILPGNRDVGWQLGGQGSGGWYREEESGTEYAK